MNRIEYLKKLKSNQKIAATISKLSSIQRDKLKLAASSHEFSGLMLFRTKGYEFIHDLDLDLRHANYLENIGDHL